MFKISKDEFGNKKPIDKDWVLLAKDLVNEDLESKDDLITKLITMIQESEEFQELKSIPLATDKAYLQRFDKYEIYGKLKWLQTSSDMFL